MDQRCNLNRDCPAAGLHAQTPAVYNACTKKQMANEAVDGCKWKPSFSEETYFFLPVLFLFLLFTAANLNNYRAQGLSLIHI